MRKLILDDQPNLNLLQKFAYQRSGIEGANYNDRKTLIIEYREICKDLDDFKEILNYALRRVRNLDEKVKETLLKSSGRLTMNEKGHLVYITGQYFPTEYRPACSRLLADLIWQDFASEKMSFSNDPVYTDGHDIRKTIKKHISKRVFNNYFN
jgi:hypothetical protein